MTCNHYLVAKRSKDEVDYFECRSCKFKFTPVQLQDVFVKFNSELKRLRKQVAEQEYQIGVMEANGGEFDG